MAASALPVVRVVGALPGLGHDPDAVRDAARDLLSRPPYRTEPRGLLAEVAAWLRDQVAAGLGWLVDRLTGDGSVVAWIVVVAAAALLAAAVWAWTRGLVVDRRAPSVPAPAPTRTAADWSEEAAGHAAAGRWREAVRARYAALVSLLAESGVVEDVPGRTVRELDRAVGSAAPVLEPAVQRAGRCFEEVWYGRAPTGPEDLAVVTAALRTVGEQLDVKVPS